MIGVNFENPRILKLKGEAIKNCLFINNQNEKTSGIKY